MQLIQSKTNVNTVNYRNNINDDDAIWGQTMTSFVDALNHITFQIDNSSISDRSGGFP